MTDETLILCTKCGINPKMKWEAVCAKCKKAANRKKYHNIKNDTAITSAKDKALWAFLYEPWYR